MSWLCEDCKHKTQYAAHYEQIMNNLEGIKDILVDPSEKSISRARIMAMLTRSNIEHLRENDPMASCSLCSFYLSQEFQRVADMFAMF